MAILIYAMELGDAPELAEALQLLIGLIEAYGYEQENGQWQRPTRL